MTSEEMKTISENIMTWRNAHLGLAMQVDHAKEVARITREQHPKVTWSDVVYVKTRQGDKRQEAKRKMIRAGMGKVIEKLAIQTAQLTENKEELERKEKAREEENEVLKNRAIESEEEIKVLRMAIEGAELRIAEMEKQISGREEEERMIALAIKEQKDNQAAAEHRRAEERAIEEDLKEQLLIARMRKQEMKEKAKQGIERMRAVNEELMMAKKESATIAKENENLIEEVAELGGKLKGAEDKEEEQQEIITLLKNQLRNMQGRVTAEEDDQRTKQLISKLQSERDQLASEI